MDLVGLLLGAGLAFAATSLGAAGVLAFKKIKPKHYAAILSFCAGVMAFSALEMLAQSHAQAGDIATFGALIAGMAVFLVLEKLLPHAHMLVRKKELQPSKKKLALVAGTVTLHNIPEGFAIASAFASSSPLGWLVSVSIAIQDFPEGLVVSAPLAAYGVGTNRSFLLGVFSGFVEFMAAIAGFVFLSAIAALTPFALAFSAGAMFYVTIFELLPDAFKGESRVEAMASFIFGIALAFGMAMLFTIPAK